MSYRIIPIMLIWSRLLFGVVMLLECILHLPHYTPISIVLLSLGLLSDIFDGIIARRLGVATQSLRRLDSSVDQAFFIMAGVAAYLQCSDFFRQHAFWIIFVLALEAMTYVVSFVKFRKEIATHTIGAKLWTLLLFSTLVEIMLHCDANVLFFLFVVFGIITRLEILAIILLLRVWTNDVPSMLQALRLRKGLPMKKNQFFN